MPIIHDDEFGAIVVRRSARASQVRLRVGPDGSLRASIPLYAPLFLVKNLIKSSRNQLREMHGQSQTTDTFYDGMRVGKSHTLVVVPSGSLHVSRRGQRIIVQLPEHLSISDSVVTRHIKDTVITALRVEAKSYLPKRLAYLAAQHGYHYHSVRFSHASGRWGSCSSKGTISLNIALMKLPFELIDYVIIHELAHTKEMNHSSAFWTRVEEGDPHYKEHRKALKDESPSI